MKVLITGANGFIGSNLAYRLETEDYIDVIKFIPNWKKSKLIRIKD